MNARRFLFSILFMPIFSVTVFSAWPEPVTISEVNSQYEEWSPFLSSDGLTLYFARVRTSESYYGRIFEANRDEPVGPFTTVRQVPGELNSLNGHVLCPCVSCDNLRMYYHTEQTGIGWNLMLSERSSTTDPWPAGIEIAELNALGKYVQMPRLTIDELTIFFQVLDRPGGQHDIWMAVRTNRNLPFEYTRNLTEINTSSNEGNPSISPDGLILYFMSDRNGTQQLFKTTRTSLDVSFSNIELLSTFNKPDDNSAHPSISSDGKAFYFVRSSAGNRTTQDIYVYYYSGDNNFYHNKLSTDSLYEIIEKTNGSE